MPSLLILAALAAATPAAADQGKPCLNSRLVDEQRIADDHTIYFRESLRWYRNDLGSVCSGLTPRRGISTRTPTNRLCEGDIITVFEPNSPIELGSCALGRFTRVDGPPPSGRRSGR